MVSDYKFGKSNREFTISDAKTPYIPIVHENRTKNTQIHLIGSASLQVNHYN